MDQQRTQSRTPDFNQILVFVLCTNLEIDGIKVLGLDLAIWTFLRRSLEASFTSMAYANHFGPKGSSRSVLKLKVSHEKFWIGHRGTHKKLLGHHGSGKCKKIRVRGRRKLEPISALLPLFLTFLGSYGYKVRLDVSILEGAHYS